MNSQTAQLGTQSNNSTNSSSNYNANNGGTSRDNFSSDNGVNSTNNNGYIQSNSQNDKDDYSMDFSVSDFSDNQDFANDKRINVFDGEVQSVGYSKKPVQNNYSNGTVSSGQQLIVQQNMGQSDMQKSSGQESSIRQPSIQQLDVRQANVQKPDVQQVNTHDSIVQPKPNVLQVNAVNSTNFRTNANINAQQASGAQTLNTYVPNNAMGNTQNLAGQGLSQDNKPDGNRSEKGLVVNVATGVGVDQQSDENLPSKNVDSEIKVINDTGDSVTVGGDTVVTNDNSKNVEKNADGGNVYNVRANDSDEKKSLWMSENEKKVPVEVEATVFENVETNGHKNSKNSGGNDSDNVGKDLDSNGGDKGGVTDRNEINDKTATSSNSPSQKLRDIEFSENKKLVKVSAYAFFIGILIVGTYFVLFMTDSKDNSRVKNKELTKEETKISNLARSVESTKPKVLPAETKRKDKSKYDTKDAVETVKYTTKEVQDGIYKYSFDDGFSLLVPAGWADCNIDFFASKIPSVGFYEYDRCPKKGDFTIKPKVSDSTENPTNEKSKVTDQDIENGGNNETNANSNKDIIEDINSEVGPTIIVSVSEKPLKYLADTSSDHIALEKMPNYTSLDVEFNRYLAQNSDTGDEYVVLSKKLPSGKFVRISVPSSVKLEDVDEVLSTFVIDDKAITDRSESE